MLAIAVVHPALISPGRASSRASSAPTGYGSGIRICARQIPHVGASLLAMAMVHPALISPGRASSRASSLPQVMGQAYGFVPDKYPCRSEPARDGGGTSSIDIACQGLIASRLTPKGYGSGIRMCARQIPHVGASLLAMAVVHPALISPARASSRAGSLPHLIGGEHQIRVPHTHRPCGSRACSR